MAEGRPVPEHALATEERRRRLDRDMSHHRIVPEGLRPYLRGGARPDTARRVGSAPSRWEFAFMRHVIQTAVLDVHPRRTFTEAARVAVDRAVAQGWLPPQPHSEAFGYFLVVLRPGCDGSLPVCDPWLRMACPRLGPIEGHPPSGEPPCHGPGWT